jgi:hypothetical protein
MSTPYDIPSDVSKIKKFQWDDKYDFPRDLVGYGENSFNPQWPNGAKIAVSFVINYEEVKRSPIVYHTLSYNSFREVNTPYSTETNTPKRTSGKPPAAPQKSKNAP